jgi:YegS/Rv2252/BmrU family lipid kinase
MPTHQKAVLIINTKSRRGREWLRPVVTTLKASGVELTEIHAIRKPDKISGEVEKAVAKKAPLIIVGGGDGTFSSVVRYFISSESTLGVLPLGTGNQFARDLGIVANVEAACQVLSYGKPTMVDVGKVNDDFFINVTTVGLTTLIADELTVAAKRRWGRVVYLFALARALQKVKPFTAQITTDEGEQTYETLQVVIGSGKYHGGPFPLAPDASITDGKLSVYALVGKTKWDLLRFAFRLPGGHHVDLANVPVFSTTGGKLETTPTRRVTVDGEIQMRTPIAFGILPRSLRVMVPQEFDNVDE